MLDSLLVISAAPARRSGMLLRAPIAAAVAAGMLCSSSCLFQKKPARVFVPPPPQPVAPVVTPPPPISAAPQIAMASSDAPDLDSLLGSTPVELEPPPAPPPQRRPPVATRPTPPPPTPEPEPAPPKIVPLFSPQQLAEYNRTLDDSLNRAQRALDVLSRRNLTAAQRDTMEQIREFLKQARQAREQDLVTAVNLAKHADGLAKDLLDRLP